ncbi:MAG: helix-hairpin-helix domain-containing protein [Pseudomonadota bacterium]
MFIHDTDVATTFSQIADLLEINGDNPFRIRAYRNAARLLNTLAPSVQTMVDEKRDLQELPGIGADGSGRPSAFCAPWTIPVLRCWRIHRAA